MSKMAQAIVEQKPSFTPAGAGLLQRKCDKCRKKQLLQRRSEQAEQSAVPPIVHDVLNAPGQPLDSETRAFFEPRFGHDFGRMQVHSVAPQASPSDLWIGPPDDYYEKEADRVADRIMSMPKGSNLERTSRLGLDFSSIVLHTDALASKSAQAVGARAFTVGQDIVFGAGQYKPGSTTGLRLLAHELAHAIQQDNNASGSLVQREDAQNEAVVQEDEGAQKTTDIAQPDASSNDCPCDPPITDVCPGKDKVLKAFQKAAGWLPKAQSAVINYINAPPNQRSAQRAAIPLKNHFKWIGQSPPPDIPSIVKSVIDSTIINMAEPVCPHCPTECPCAGKEPYACSPNAWHETNCYTLCDLFFTKAGDTERAKIAIHEMMHSWEGMGDAAYEGDSNYPPDPVVAQLTADCYAALIRDLG
jgi:hypothetical protein